MTALDDLRTRMDEITVQMMHLLKERTDISSRIGAVKKQQDLRVHDKSREGSLRDMVLGTAADIGMSADVAGGFLNYLLSHSLKVQSDGAPSHLAVFRRAKEMERTGKRVIHMELGEPDFAPPPGAGAALLEGFEAGHTRYGLPAGMPRLRSALAEFVSDKHGAPVPPDGVLVTPGARFAVFSAITTLASPGEEIIIIEPAWPAYRDAAFHAGIKPRVIPTTLEGRWEPSLAEIEEAITPQTRMIVLSYPSNPTGKILPGRLMDGIMELASRRGLYVLSDEIYYDYHHRGTRPKSVLEYEYDKSVVAQSFSKSHAMMGFRIGYAVAPPRIIDQMTRLSALCLTGVAGVIQYAALKSIRHDNADGVRTIQSRLRTITRMGRRAGLQFAEPDGAMYVFARMPGISGTDLVDRCLGRGLALAPGIGFGHYPEFVRISAGTGEVEDGMHILSDILQDDDTWRE